MKMKQKNESMKKEIPGAVALADDALDFVIGGLTSPTELLRPLKNRVIGAVNDTNTETDRETIKREIDASIHEIDDNALQTFSGRSPNSGRS